jgi:hypothetical protein
MTKFVVDCGVVLELASKEIEVRAEHELLAPTLLRSQTLSATACCGGGPGKSPTNSGGPRPTTPSTLLTQLQADAFVTLDAELARRVEGIVPTATVEALQTR